MIDLLKKLDWGAHGPALVKPDTFVNRTGERVEDLFQRRHASVADLLVVCDDVNLPLGRIRLRAKGSAGGHNGLVSIIQSIRSEGFARLRIGIGPAAETEDLAGFVLAPFTKEEEENLKSVLTQATGVCRIWFEKGIQAAMDELSKEVNR